MSFKLGFKWVHWVSQTNNRQELFSALGYSFKAHNPALCRPMGSQTWMQFAITSIGFCGFPSILGAFLGLYNRNGFIWGFEPRNPLYMPMSILCVEQWVHRHGCNLSLPSPTVTTGRSFHCRHHHVYHDTADLLTLRKLLKNIQKKVL